LEHDHADDNCSHAIVRILENHGVTHVFGIPGAKIDSLFVALKHSRIQLVVCRHEQNAAFMAAAFGRVTGRVGVCIATSGPGVTNLTTGLATATSEGDAVLAIGGEVALGDRLKKTHQSLDAVSLMRPVTKFAAEVASAAQLGEVIGNAIRAAESGRPGAAFVSLPKDVGLAPFPGDAGADWTGRILAGAGAPSEVAKAAAILNASQRPVALLGMQASQPDLAEPLVAFLRATGIPFTSTFQGPGAWVESQGGSVFAGRIGLFRNQPADHLLDAADAVLAIGFDPIEYDPSLWNAGNPRPILCVDTIPADRDNAFLPAAEILGDIGASLTALQAELGAAWQGRVAEAHVEAARAAAQALRATIAEGRGLAHFPVHPLRLVHELQRQMTPRTHVAFDVGSNYIWASRYCAADFARQVMVSNGQQTLGVSVPWAIALSLLHPGERVLSMSGDGGFLFTATELETAVRVGAKFVHVIWDSRSYDMVEFQEVAHYGESAGVGLGGYDVVKFAEAFGCEGYSIRAADELPVVLEKAFAADKPVLIHVPVDYSFNARLMQDVMQHFLD
jgi:acetolactate synthase-1/2/3 large subunit